MHQMAARPEPGLVAALEAEIGDALGRHQPAIGDAAGKFRILGAEQQRPHSRMDTVGADQDVGGDALAVGEFDLDRIAALGNAKQAMAEMDVLDRQTGAQ